MACYSYVSDMSYVVPQTCPPIQFITSDNTYPSEYHLYIKLLTTESPVTIYPGCYSSARGSLYFAPYSALSGYQVMVSDGLSK